MSVGCGDGLITPSTLAPVIVCPAPISIATPDGNPVAVTYEPPQIIAGEPPLTIACAPPSGSRFPLGTANVSCTVQDAVLRQNACTFTVTVTNPPRLVGTKFLAFGNSITEGKTASGATPNNYPAKLLDLLRVRYTAQVPQIEVINRGIGGEKAVDGAARLENELIAFRPDALLLEQGINDLGEASDIHDMIDALRDMVREAKSRGVTVFLATLTPAREGGTPPRGNSAAPLVDPANSQIRLLALNESVTLVDIYEGFGRTTDPYIDVDGLHPNVAGYQKMAELFFEAIRSRLEVGSANRSMELVRFMPGAAAPFSRLRN